METIADILEGKGTEVWTISPGASVGDAVELMTSKNIGAVVVTGDDGRPLGILSERDVARGLIKHRTDLADRPVYEFMTPNVKCIRGRLTIEEAMAVMTHGRIRHLPVCDSGKVAGIVSIGDVVKAAIHDRDIVIEQLEHYIAGSL